jgi:hypothetical protein
MSAEVHAAPPPAAGESRGAPLRWPPLTCIAPTRFGPLVLTLQGQAAHAPPAVDTVCAALLLAQAEPLLQILEDWLGEPLDPEPGAPAEAEACAAQAEALLGSADGQAQLHACVQLPWAALQACRPEDAALRERLQALQWKAVPAQLVLSRQALTADEWATLAQTGAALLLPESMAQPAWRCLLRAPQHHEVPPLQVQWEPVQGELHWPAAGAVPAPPQEAVMVEAVLEATVHLTPPQWLAWDGPQALACSGQRAALVRVDAPGPALAGDLLPLALGAGGAGGVLLRVDALPGSADAQG